MAPCYQPGASPPHTQLSCLPPPGGVFPQAPKTVVALVWEAAALQSEGVLRGLDTWVYRSCAYPEKINACPRNAGGRDSDCICVFLLAVV